MSSRTAKSVKNSYYSLIFYGIELFLKFYSRKIFLEYLGTELLGLNTTVLNILQFLNLAELGIGVAIAVTLYKPIQANDKNTIGKIVRLQGFLYRRIASCIMGASVIIMFFFPLIFSKTDLPLYYCYATFIVMLFSTLLGYFINFKQVILEASQENYKIQVYYKSWSLFKVLVQIVLVRSLPFPYLWWLIAEIIFSIIATISLNSRIQKDYPYLNKLSGTFTELKDKFPQVLKKTKQLFFHKIALFILTQTSPIIIYAYLSLTAVALYGNYMTIVAGLILLINALFNGFIAGVGNLVAEGQRSRIISVFEELYSIRFFVISLLCTICFFIIQPFISLWIGNEYLLPESTVLIISLIMFLNMYKLSVETFINAYGLYQDIYSPIIEGFLNISLSIILGYFWGLNGILSGVLISLGIIQFGWKPFFLYSRGFKIHFSHFIKLFLTHIAILIGSVICLFVLSRFISINPYANIGNLLLYTLLLSIGFGSIMICLMYFFTRGFKLFIHRIHHTINL